MESSVGYSQGTGTNIATHKFGTGTDAVHHQRFAVGAGRADMQQLMYPTTSASDTALLSCEGAGRIIISPLCSSSGTTLTVHFFDANKMDIGASAYIELELSDYNAYQSASSGWVGSTLYPKGALLKIPGNSHVYRQIVDPDGTTGGSAPSWPTDGSTVVDGTAEWDDMGVYTGLQTCRLLVFSNSMGASYYLIEVGSVSGTLAIWGDAV
jgi:hypothetical protein